MKTAKREKKATTNRSRIQVDTTAGPFLPSFFIPRFWWRMHSLRHCLYQRNAALAVGRAAIEGGTSL